MNLVESSENSYDQRAGSQAQRIDVPNEKELHQNSRLSILQRCSLVRNCVNHQLERVINQLSLIMILFQN